MHTLRLVPLLALPALTVAEVGDAQIVLTGTLSDSGGRPVAYARVELVGVGGMTASDPTGRYRLVVRDTGTYLLEIRRLGFQPQKRVVSLMRRSLHVQDFVLEQIAGRLDATTIIATAPDQSLLRRGFYDRQTDAEKGLLSGSFVTPEQLLLRRPSRITQVLGDLPGVRVAGGTRGGLIMSQRGNCAMTVYVDGVRLHSRSLTEGTAGSTLWGSVAAAVAARQGASRPNRDEQRDATIDEFVQPSDVVGIEVYPLASFAPARFQTLNGTCGIVAVWTK